MKIQKMSLLTLTIPILIEQILRSLMGTVNRSTVLAVIGGMQRDDAFSGT